MDDYLCYNKKSTKKEKGERKMPIKVIHEKCQVPHSLSELRCGITPCGEGYPKIVTWNDPKEGKIYALVGSYSQVIIKRLTFCPACGTNLYEEEEQGKNE